MTAEESLWLAAVARGSGHPAVLGPVVYAHTSPVYVTVDGGPVHRPASARWLLDWLDRLEELVRREGTFADDRQEQDLHDLVNQARSFYEARAG